MRQFMTLSLGLLVCFQSTLGNLSSNRLWDAQHVVVIMNDTTSSLHSLLLQGQNVKWASSAWILTVTVLILLLAYSNRQVPFPKSAPSLLGENLPIVGALRFFVSRATFLKDGASTSKTGNFSFYVGKHQVVGLSGLEGRRTFYDSKDLSSHQGQVFTPERWLAPLDSPPLRSPERRL